MSNEVRPGRETGVYYLVLGGLSFSLTWRDLLNHARKHNIEVEYAEVFPKIGGWIRILDHATFLRAFEIFNGADLKGNPILADARNEYECVPLYQPPPPLRNPPASIGPWRRNPASHSPISPIAPPILDEFSSTYQTSAISYTPQYSSSSLPRFGGEPLPWAYESQMRQSHNTDTLAEGTSREVPNRRRSSTPMVVNGSNPSPYRRPRGQ